MSADNRYSYCLCYGSVLLGSSGWKSIKAKFSDHKSKRSLNSTIREVDRDEMSRLKKLDTRDDNLKC